MRRSYYTYLRALRVSKRRFDNVLPAETSAAEEDRTSRLEVDVTAMALLGEEQPVTTEVAAVTASAENGGDKPAARRSNSSQQLHVPSDGSLNGAHSEASSNVRKNASQGQGATAAAGPTIISSLSTPSLPTKRTVRELLETRNTPSKMEIGQGVMLLADISGAELVVIRGLFQGSIKAQCIDVEQGAEVQGNVECEAARIDGKFDGVFVSTHSLHLASHADVSGRIVYRRLKVAKGAQIYGHSEYRSPVLSK